jgi:hypothetical protein
MITQEQHGSSVATAERVRDIVMGLVLEACHVTGPGACDAKSRDETLQAPASHAWPNGGDEAAHGKFQVLRERMSINRGSWPFRADASCGSCVHSCLEAFGSS